MINISQVRDILTNNFEVTLVTRPPIIVVDVSQGMANSIIVNDAAPLTTGDVLVSLHYRLLIHDIQWIEDLFENFWRLGVVSVSGIAHVSDILEKGEELKLLASTHEETRNK